MFNRYESCQNREIWFDSIKEWDNVIHVIERMTKCIRIELCRVSYLDQRVQIVLGWLHIVQLRRSKSVVETGLLYQHMHARERAHKFKINCCAVNLLELRSFSNHSSSDRERRWEGRTDSPSPTPLQAAAARTTSPPAPTSPTIPSRGDSQGPIETEIGISNWNTRLLQGGLTMALHKTSISTQILFFSFESYEICNHRRRARFISRTEVISTWINFDTLVDLCCSEQHSSI